jgi:hypothetical protein
MVWPRFGLVIGSIQIMVFGLDMVKCLGNQDVLEALVDIKFFS